MFKGPIALGSIRTSFVLGGRLVIQAGTLLLVARMLGPQDFGAFVGIASLAVLLGTLSSFGTQLVLLGEVSKEASRRDTVLSYAIPTTLLCGSILLVFYLVLANWALPIGNMSWSVLLAIGVTELILQPFFNFMATEYHALGRIASAQIMRSSPLFLRLVTAACIFSFGWCPALVIYAVGYFSSSVIVLLLGAYYLPKKWPDWRVWRFPGTAELRHAGGYAATNISKMGPAELDKILAVKLLSADTAGLYAAGARVVSAITLPITAMTLSALPRLFRESEDRDVGSQILLKWMYVASFLYGLGLSGVLWLFSPVLEILFGSQYQGMQDAVRWLCLAVPGIALRLVGGNALMALGKPWLRAGFEIAGLSILAVASFWLTSKMGVKGMALAVVCAEWGMAVVALGGVIQSHRVGNN